MPRISPRRRGGAGPPNRSIALPQAAGQPVRWRGAERSADPASSARTEPTCPHARDVIAKRKNAEAPRWGARRQTCCCLKACAKRSARAQLFGFLLLGALEIVVRLYD
jgi:hypothetical protein